MPTSVCTYRQTCATEGRRVLLVALRRQSLIQTFFNPCLKARQPQLFRINSGCIRHIATSHVTPFHNSVVLARSHLGSNRSLGEKRHGSTRYDSSTVSSHSISPTTVFVHELSLCRVANHKPVTDQATGIAELEQHRNRTAASAQGYFSSMTVADPSTPLLLT